MIKRRKKMGKLKFLLFPLICIMLGLCGAVSSSRPKEEANKDRILKDELSEQIALAFQEDAAGALTIKDEETKELIAELELLGTAISNPKERFAFIKDLKSDKLGTYKLGSLIRGAEVVQIERGEVTLNFKGRKIQLQLSNRGLKWANANKENPAIVSASSSQIVVSKKGLLNETDKILESARAIKVKPAYQSKKVTGMVIEGVSKDSIIAQAGIRDKDIVTTVNNQKIDSYQKALQVFSKAKNQSEINVGLLRDGQVKNLSYRLTN